ncbi:MAG: WG repeat-containing protein, partial [Bacteroidales bacterium]|nr:WG repeat-containing protein [Bacteroidales bacterium]
MIAKPFLRLMAAAIAAVLTLPVAAESFMLLDHNPYATKANYLYRDGKFVFFDEAGNTVTEVDNINLDYLEWWGYYYAKSLNKLWGIIDKHGRWIIEPSAKDLLKAPFRWCRYGYILKKDQSTGKWGIINLEGEWVVQPQFKSEYDIYPLDE